MVAIRLLLQDARVEILFYRHVDLSDMLSSLGTSVRHQIIRGPEFSGSPDNLQGQQPLQSRSCADAACLEVSGQ